MMGQRVAYPASWSPAGCPPASSRLECSVSDLIDWPANMRDGYVFANNTASAVANAYVANAVGRMAEVAGWLGERGRRAVHSLSTTILRTLRGWLARRRHVQRRAGPLARVAARHSLPGDGGRRR